MSTISPTIWALPLTAILRSSAIASKRSSRSRARWDSLWVTPSRNGSRMIRTGSEYLESIRDGREVYINGERVKDLATHPMLKPLIDIRARIYDMQHERATREILAYQEAGEWHAIANKLPRSQEDWQAKRRATDAVLDDIGGVVTRV